MALEPGHSFLARLGKTKLRPGGIEATNWLIDQAHIKADTKVLEVACNMGTTMMSVAQHYGCHVIGIDQSPAAIAKAQKNIAKNHLTDQLEVFQGNAMKLPFEDESFDVVINEAMLTMLSERAKHKAIAEYYRVLKHGGVLLTHDVCLMKGDSPELIRALGEAIHVHAQPLTSENWQREFSDAGFSVEQNYGAMTLMNPAGMIHDEGFFRAVKIVFNGLKPRNRQQFFKMFRFFKGHRDQLGYIANFSRKP